VNRKIVRYFLWHISLFHSKNVDATVVSAVLMTIAIINTAATGLSIGFKSHKDKLSKNDKLHKFLLEELITELDYIYTKEELKQKLYDEKTVNKMKIEKKQIQLKEVMADIEKTKISQNTGSIFLIEKAEAIEHELEMIKNEEMEKENNLLEMEKQIKDKKILNLLILFVKLFLTSRKLPVLPEKDSDGWIQSFMGEIDLVQKKSIEKIGDFLKKYLITISNESIKQFTKNKKIKEKSIFNLWNIKNKNTYNKDQFVETIESLMKNKTVTANQISIEDKLIYIVTNFEQYANEYPINLRNDFTYIKDLQNILVVMNIYIQEMGLCKQECIRILSNLDLLLYDKLSIYNMYLQQVYIIYLLYKIYNDMQCKVNMDSGGLDNFDYTTTNLLDIMKGKDFHDKGKDTLKLLVFFEEFYKNIIPEEGRNSNPNSNKFVFYMGEEINKDTIKIVVPVIKNLINTMRIIKEKQNEGRPKDLESNFNDVVSVGSKIATTIGTIPTSVK
jgi:hypothetical protein